jgi:cold shock CspA family protein/ribosome-associated translation inhibitor RaiA
MEVHWLHPDAYSEHERLSAESRIHELAADRTDLIDVRITTRATQHHRLGEREVHIVCEARGKQIVVARTRAEAGLALNEALDVFEQEVLRMRDRRTEQRTERPQEPPELGVVDQVLVDKGFGFILTDAGERVYFHRNAVQHGLEFDRLEEGQRVGLNFEAGIEGPQATVVVPAPPGASTP